MKFASLETGCQILRPSPGTPTPGRPLGLKVFENGSCTLENTRDKLVVMSNQRRPQQQMAASGEATGRGRTLPACHDYCSIDEMNAAGFPHTFCDIFGGSKSNNISERLLNGKFNSVL